MRARCIVGGSSTRIASLRISFALCSTRGNSQSSKDRYDLIRVRRQVDELADRAVVEGELEVVAIRARAVRDDRDVIGCRERNDAARLGDPTAPRDVRLQHVAALALEKLPEAVARVLVFARSQQAEVPHRRLNLGIAVIVIRRQELLDPLDAARDLSRDAAHELDRVGHRQRHVTVDHKGKVDAYGGTDRLNVLDVLAHARVAVTGPIRQRNLAPHEAELLGQVWARRRAVDGELVLCLPTCRKTTAACGQSDDAPCASKWLVEGEVGGCVHPRQHRKKAPTHRGAGRLAGQAGYQARPTAPGQPRKWPESRGPCGHS